MSITVSTFGNMKDNEAKLYVLKNAAGMTAAVSDLGAVLVSLYVKDRQGQFRDVVLGFDDVESYEEKNDTFYGATIGRCGNRIGKAQCQISGKTYTFDKNDGNNNLHGGFHGYQTRLWQVKDKKDDDTPFITFELHSPDMDQGFPGNADIRVTYALTADNSLEISYDAVADADTIFNMTNHSYFNLNGHDSGTILSQEVKINGDAFTWADEESIPTGELTPVAGTPMDFREYHAIGERIEADYTALKFGQGYDHNYCVNDSGKEKIVASMRSGESGIVMEVRSDLPGMQLYTGNFIKGDQNGKGGCAYPRRSGSCFETQYYPDAPNHPEFAQPVFAAGTHYQTKTVYHFEVE